MKKICTLLAIIIIISSSKLTAGEGMWLPILLKQLNEKEMQKMGMRITAEDIYSINQTSLKDAIVIFGGGCTGEVVSDKGLIFTNHHCGYRNIQSHSTLQNDYLSEGFWAKSMNEELPNPGLSVIFLVSMEDVTDKVLNNVSEGLNNTEKNKIIDNNIKNLIDGLKLEPNIDAVVESYFYGNQYFLLLTKKYKDVRLVGAPPSDIGKFGGDTDNWMWPRHTGDFSLFRIYTDKNNEPAEYSKDNVPYKPLKHLTISLKGIAENDFTFIFGYPGSTEEYIPSFSVDQIVNGSNPIAINLRGKRLEIIENARNNDPLIKIQYASKSANVANTWKKMIGESRGIKLTKAIEEKKQFENTFNNWAKQNNTKYQNILSSFSSLHSEYNTYLNNYMYYRDGLFGIEILQLARSFSKTLDGIKNNKLSDKELETNLNNLNIYLKQFYKDYNVDVDKKIFESIVKEFYLNTPKEVSVDYLSKIYVKSQSVEQLANDIYSNSIFTDSAKVFSLINEGNRKKIAKLEKDPAYILIDQIFKDYLNKVVPKLHEYFSKSDSLQHNYMKAQLEMQPDTRFYPDANFTLRVGYGNILPFTPSDGVKYNWFTTLDGIIQKENPEIADYYVSPKLKELYYKKDYGQYADKDGKMHVAFIASNHTTGGNSGSPVFNADGHLIGINFDRCWEGTMSDLKYDVNLCRNISVDIRYCLFIIDKYAGAKHLIDEMTIIK